MSNLEIISELCEICDIQAGIIRRLEEALEQVGAVVEIDTEEAQERYSALLGRDEAPDDAPGQNL